MGDFIIESGVKTVSVSGNNNLWAAQPADAAVYLTDLYLYVSAAGLAGAYAYVRDGATGDYICTIPMNTVGGFSYKFGGLGYELTGNKALILDLNNVANVASSASPYWGVVKGDATGLVRGLR